MKRMCEGMRGGTSINVYCAEEVVAIYKNKTGGLVYLCSEHLGATLWGRKRPEWSYLTYQDRNNYV